MLTVHPVCTRDRQTDPEPRGALGLCAEAKREWGAGRYWERAERRYQSRKPSKPSYKEEGDPG